MAGYWEYDAPVSAIADRSGDGSVSFRDGTWHFSGGGNLKSYIVALGKAGMQSQTDTLDYIEPLCYTANLKLYTELYPKPSQTCYFDKDDYSFNLSPEKYGLEANAEVSLHLRYGFFVHTVDGTLIKDDIALTDIVAGTPKIINIESVNNWFANLENVNKKICYLVFQTQIYARFTDLETGKTITNLVTIGDLIDTSFEGDKRFGYADLTDDLAVMLNYRYPFELDGDTPKVAGIADIPTIFGDDLPDSLWRIDVRANNGYPFHKLLPDIQQIAPIIPVYQSEYITVHDSRTAQDSFDDNGLAVLDPISCRVTEILNGKYELTLEHPIDDTNKWHYLTEYNIIKALGQLFAITYTDHSWNGNIGRVNIRAEHIFYHQNDLWCFPDGRVMGSTTGELITSMQQNVHKFTDPGQVYYRYSWAGDVEVPEGARDKWNGKNEGKTPVEYILGNDGFVTTCGGELYRDNFYYSLNQTMEGALENSFDIRVGLNLLGIRRVLDTSSYCSYFRGYDKFGSWFAVAWAPQGYASEYPHKVTRSKNFNYDIDPALLSDDWTEADESFSRLSTDVMAYFKQNCNPSISYTINLRDVRRNPDYKEFINNPRYKVGDSGRIYDERLGLDITLKITKTVKDAVTGDTLEVTFGSVRSLTRLQGYNTSAVGNNQALVPTVENGAIQLKDSAGAWLFDSDGNRLMERI